MIIIKMEEKVIDNITKGILKKYFKKSNRDNAEYYYINNNKVEYYEMLDESDKFEEEIKEWGRQHVRINIKMFDKRNNVEKMMYMMLGGFYMQDLNFTAFDLIDNINLGKYEGNLNKLEEDLVKCACHQVLSPNSVLRVENEDIPKKKVEKLRERATEMCKILSNKDKHEYARMKYHTNAGLNDECIKVFEVYLGCEVSLVTDPSWFGKLLKR